MSIDFEPSPGGSCEFAAGTALNVGGVYTISGTDDCGDFSSASITCNSEYPSGHDLRWTNPVLDIPCAIGLNIGAKTFQGTCDTPAVWNFTMTDYTGCSCCET
jgi:hypothetical protein